jgi:CTP synthase (UTP-ammonia lyase)
MQSQTKIAIVGDFDPQREHHQMTNESLEHAGNALGVMVTGDWIPTDSLHAGVHPAKLERYDAVFLAPGSPYRSMDGAFAAVRFAREQGWPFFAT